MRPSRDEYFISMAELAATRSTCTRRRVGAVAVKNDHVLATGYNGAPSGLPHCEDAGCIRDQESIPSGEKHELCRGVHAEQNLICQAAYHGVSLSGVDIYCTNQPCSICAKMLLNVGVGKIYYANGYPDDMTQEILRGRMVKLPNSTATYTLKEILEVERLMLGCDPWRNIKNGKLYYVNGVLLDCNNSKPDTATVSYNAKCWESQGGFARELSEFKSKFEPYRGE